MARPSLRKRLVRQAIRRPALLKPLKKALREEQAANPRKLRYGRGHSAADEEEARMQLAGGGIGKRGPRRTLTRMGANFNPKNSGSESIFNDTREPVKVWWNVLGGFFGKRVLGSGATAKEKFPPYPGFPEGEAHQVCVKLGLRGGNRQHCKKKATPMPGRHIIYKVSSWMRGRRSILVKPQRRVRISPRQRGNPLDQSLDQAIKQRVDQEVRRRIRAPAFGGGMRRPNMGRYGTRPYMGAIRRLPAYTSGMSPQSMLVARESHGSDLEYSALESIVVLFALALLALFSLKKLRGLWKHREILQEPLVQT